MWKAFLLPCYLASIRISFMFPALNIMHTSCVIIFSNYRGMVESDRILCLLFLPLSGMMDPHLVWAIYQLCKSIYYYNYEVMHHKFIPILLDISGKFMGHSDIVFPMYLCVRILLSLSSLCNLNCFTFPWLLHLYRYPCVFYVACCILPPGHSVFCITCFSPANSFFIVLYHFLLNT